MTSDLERDPIENEQPEQETRQADKAGDMAYFNQAAYSMTNIVTGPRITTLFKANQRSDHALWKHK